MPKKLENVMRNLRLAMDGETKVSDFMLNHYPVCDVWRLFVDGDLQYCEQWFGFEEREPGYLSAMYSLYSLFFDFSIPLNVESIIRIHQMSIEHVKNTNYDKGQIDKFGFRDRERMQFNISSEITSIAGLLQFLKQMENAEENSFNYFCVRECMNGVISSSHPSAFFIHPKVIQKLRDISLDMNYDEANFTSIINQVKTIIPSMERYVECALNWSLEAKEVLYQFFYDISRSQNNYQMATFIYNIVNQQDDLFEFAIVSHQRGDVKEVLSNKITSYLAEFEESIKNINSPIERLRLIVRLIQRCELLHPFYDGNCRTFCMWLTNHLLLKYDFPFVIQEDPNGFDFLSEDQLILKLIEGMENTLALINTGELYLLNTQQFLDMLKINDSQVFDNFTDGLNILKKEIEDLSKTCVSQRKA